jgi:hypothetical protein
VASQRRLPTATLASPGEALAWVAALVFALSSFMSWYSAENPIATISVTAWNTGTVGKLVFFIGLAVIVFLFLHATGVELPPAIRSGMVVAALGTVGTILVLVRIIDIPDKFDGSGRSIGLWISLVSALLIVVAGLLRAGEEIESSRPSQVER